VKSRRFLSFVLLPLLIGCSAREETAAASPAKVTTVTAVATPVAVTTIQPAVVTPAVPVPAAMPEQLTPPPVAVPAAAITGDVPASETWDSIKDDDFDQRAHFAAGVERITTRVDNAMQILRDKRSTLPETSTQDWDFAMKELGEARSNLRYQFTELNKATPETWSEAKDRVAGAWQRVRDDYDQVKLSTTI
jgi:hypothetical protein